MNRNLSSKLLLLFLSVILIACEQKDNISKSSSNKYNNEIQDYIKKEENDPYVNQENNTNVNKTTNRERFIVAGVARNTVK